MTSPSHRAALAMSNWGVDLIRMRLVRQGYAAIQQAVITMRIGVLGCSNNEDMPSPFNTSLLNKESTHDPYPGTGFASIADDDWEFPDCAAESLEAACQRPHFVRIVGDERDHDVDVAIMLHNLGLATKLLGDLLPIAAARQDVQRQALQLLQLAQTALQAAVTRMCDAVKLQKLIFLSVVATASLAEFIEQTNGPSSADECRGNLEQLRQAFGNSCLLPSTAAGAA